MEKLNSKKFEKYGVATKDLQKVLAGASGRSVTATCNNTSSGAATSDWQRDVVSDSAKGQTKILPAANNISSR